VGKTEGKKLLRRPRRRCDNDIKMDLKRNMVVWLGLVSSGSRERSVEGFFEPSNEPSSAIKYWEFLE
jgi:hypothetical protein